MLRNRSAQRNLRAHDKRRFAPYLQEGRIAPLEPRSLAAPVLVLEVPTAGIGGWALGGLEPIVRQSDDSNGAMLVQPQVDFNYPDYFQDGTDFTASGSAVGWMNVTTGAAPNGNQSIGISVNQTAQVDTSGPFNGNAVGVNANSQVGTDSNGDGSTPLIWDLVDSTTGTAYSGPVQLSGTISVQLAISGTNPGNVGSGVSFMSSATGVSVVSSGNDLIVNYPVDGVPTTATISGFFSGGGGGSYNYSTGDITAPSTETIHYTSTVGCAVNVGPQGTYSAKGELDFSFSEKIEAAS